MGIQAVAARRINAPSLPTVVFTTTLTNIVMAATDAVVRRASLSHDTKRQIGIFAVYLAALPVSLSIAWRVTDNRKRD